MPSSPLDLFAAAGVKHAGSSPRKEPLPESCPGVYLVSLSSDPSSSAG